MKIEEAAHIEAIIACMHRRDLAQAVDKYRLMIRLRPKDLFCRGFLEYALERAGDWDGAIAELGEILRIARSNTQRASAHMRLGRALSAKGQTVAAIAEFREAARLAPSCAPFRDAAGKAERGCDQ